VAERPADSAVGRRVFKSALLRATVASTGRPPWRCRASHCMMASHASRPSRIQTPTLLLRRASERARPPAVGPDDYDVIESDGETMGRVLRARIAPADTPWMWSLVAGR
jgi:hypothetical protein